MFILGVKWSNDAWTNWENQPVLTSFGTTALDISKVPFPMVTFCPNGYSNRNLWSWYFYQLKEFGIDISVDSPNSAARIYMTGQNLVRFFSSLNICHFVKLYLNSHFFFILTFNWM